MLDPKTGHDERLLGHDPRAAVRDAECALWGLWKLMQDASDDVPILAVSAIVQLIHERLEPAALSLQKFRDPAE